MINQLEMMAVISLDVILKGILFLVLIFIFLSYCNENLNKLPPGPWGIPIFGVMPFLNKPSHIKFQEYYKKYGKLFSCYIGNKFTVVISDFELIKEAFVQKGEIFSGRPDDTPFKLSPQDKGIVVSDGNDYKQFKSFILSTLKDVGAVRAQFEAIVKINAEHFVEFVETISEKSVNILEPLGLSVAQTYSQLLFGKELQLNDPILIELVALFYEEVRLYNNGARLFLPWVKKIPIISKYIGEDDLRRTRSRIYEIFEMTLKENLDSYEEGSRQNFLHSWLTEDRKRKLINPNDNLFEKDTLFFNLDLLFEAGYETTTTSLRWAFIFLLNHPHAQLKIIQELDDVIGHDRLPSLDDELFLPYTMATIQEIHRCASILPLGVHHKTMESTTLGGYHIPKDSIIFANLYAVHTDPVLFPDPLKFKPERFIDDDGKFIKSNDIISFSIGTRKCPGERMAHIEIFIYLTYLLQNFRLEKAGDDELIESNRGSSVSTNPMDYNIKFINRKNNVNYNEKLFFKN